MPLVERDEELGVLESVVARAHDGRGGTAVVLGQAGLGKTALLRAVTAHARDRGLVVATAVVGELEAQAPFGVVRRLLDTAVRDLGAADLARLADGPARLALAQLWGLPGGPDPRPQSPTQGDMLHSLRWLVADLGAGRPWLLVVDDAQWADSDSLLLLGSLRDLLLDRGIALVVAARDAAVDRAPALSALVADRDAAVVRLAALSDRGTETLLAEVWDEVDGAAAAAVFEVTDGNPFLVIALAGALQVTGADVSASRVRAAVPDSVVDLVVAGLAGRSDDERALARAVAVLDAAPLATASRLAGLGLDAAAQAADALRRSGMFADDDRLCFRHALLRAAVDATLGRAERDALHRAAARLLAEGTEAEAVSGAAAHLLAATGSGDPWAVTVLRAAAAEALAVGAPQPAVALLRRAVAEPAGADVLPELLRDLGEAEARSFDPACVVTLDRAVALAAGPASRARSALALSLAYSYAGQHALAAATLEELLDAADLAAVDADLARRVEAAWAAVALLVPALVPRARDRLAALPDLSGATPGERVLLVQRLTAAAGTNQPAPVLRALADRVVGDWGSPEQLPESGDWVWPRLFLAAIGDYDRARDLTDVGLAAAAGRGSLTGVVTASFVRGYTELHAGALPDAERHYRRMLAPDPTARGAGLGLLVETLGLGGLAQSLALQGRPQDAARLLARLPEQLPADAPVNGAAMFWVGRAVVRRALEDHGGAVAAAEQVGRLGAELGIDSPTWAAWRALAIPSLQALGRLDEARALAVEHLALCRAGEVAHLVGEACGLAATVATSAEEALALAEEAVDLLRSTGSRLRFGAASLTLGALRRRTGARLDAREHLLDAVEVLSACGAIPLAQFARAELAATGTSLTRADQRVLTPSERRVAELARAGLSNPEIALRLHVSRKTVETHLSAVYRKLDLSGRDQLGEALGA